MDTDSYDMKIEELKKKDGGYYWEAIKTYEGVVDPRVKK